jgi:hypothetical protein
MTQQVERRAIHQANAQRQIDLMRDQELRQTYLQLCTLTQSNRSFHGLALHDWKSLINREAARRGVK